MRSSRGGWEFGRGRGCWVELAFRVGTDCLGFLFGKFCRGGEKGKGFQVEKKEENKASRSADRLGKYWPRFEVKC